MAIFLRGNIWWFEYRALTVRLQGQTWLPQYITTVAGVYDILFGIRRCRINLPNRCYHLISRVAHRAYFLDEDERSDPGHPKSPQQKYALGNFDTL